MRYYLQLNIEVISYLFTVLIHRRRLRCHEAVRQMVRMGVEALPMVFLTTFTIGITLAMQSAFEMDKLGAADLVPMVVTKGLMRELGALIVAIIVIGRTGSAVTAELGTMKVNEEIEALNVMAIGPMSYLIVPRCVAMMGVLPALTVFGVCIGMVGGWVICHYSLQMTTTAYLLNCFERTEVQDLYVGVLKSVVFGWLVVTIACYYGLRVKGSAESVGLSTTRSVAVSLLAVLIANALVTACFFF